MKAAVGSIALDKAREKSDDHLMELGTTVN